MTDRKAFTDPNETPEDVATLYSWANLHGAKYRDFSASRAQTREKARQRVQEAIEAEHRRSREQAEARKTAELAGEVAQTKVVEGDRQDGFASAGLRSSAENVSQAAPPPEQPAWVEAADPGWANGAPVLPYSASPPSYVQPSISKRATPPAYAAPPAPLPPAPPSAYVPRGDPYPNGRPTWSAGDAIARPAWLSERPDSTGHNHSPSSAETLQGSRDRLTSRWFALKGVFAQGAAPLVEPPPPSAPASAPVLAVFSLAGGVGKTSIVATLGRSLAARGERVLLVDTAAYGILPFFFGARDQRPGVLRTFTGPASGSDAPVQVLTIDPDALGPENALQEGLTAEIGRNCAGANRVIVDLATASGATTRRVLRLSPTVLIPVIPDMSSVVSVSAIDAFFRNNRSTASPQVLPYYLLNQFDPSLPLHLDVREVLREQLGERLLPFVLRRTQSVSEALAEGMTVVDYAPNSTLAEDFGTLAGWVKGLAAPAAQGFRGVRWSEK